MKKTKINLGCGTKTFKDMINVDFLKGKNVDVVHNLNEYPWPFKSYSVDYIYCDNVIEHVRDFNSAMKEIYRVLRKGGEILIKVPYFSNPGAFNPDHRSFFNPDSFDVFCRNTELRMGLRQEEFFMVSKRVTFITEYKKSIFLKIVYALPKLVYKISPKAYVWFFSYTFPASEIHFVLRK